MLEKSNKSRSWYQLKGVSDQSLNDKETWVSHSKIIGGVGGIMVVGMDILVFIAYIFGKSS